MTKAELINRLNDRGAFWSYHINSPEDVPDEVLIEHTLRWSDVPEILSLFNIFPKQKIKHVWEFTLATDERIYPHNYYLAKVFFKIDEPVKYISDLQKQNNRYERLKKLIT